MNTQQIQLIASLPIVYLCLVSIPILITDVRERRVPNKYTLPTIWLWLVSAIAYALLSGEWLWGLVMPIIFGLAFIIILTYINAKWESIGMGDVKLLAFMGLSLSWKFAWVWLVLPLVSMALAIATTFLVMWITRREIVGGRLAPFVYLVYFVLVAVLFSV
jgi:leader peptidase (prepilin peptidase)/N-methyltransferase